MGTERVTVSKTDKGLALKACLQDVWLWENVHTTKDIALVRFQGKEMCEKMCNINRIVEGMFLHSYLSTLMYFIYIKAELYIEVPGNSLPDLSKSEVAQWCFFSDIG